MTTRITRRKLITTAVTAAAGVSGVGIAASIAGRYGLIPPDHYGPYGVGETLTYAAQRVLTSGYSLAREFDRSQISPVPPVNGEPPGKESYRRHLDAGFADWRLPIDGLVARPASLSLDDLKGLPARSQITLQACEEGWSFIAEWAGAPLSSVLELVGAAPHARYVFFFAYDDWFESIDMADALHPQTMLAYGMNGQPLPPDHGAPARLKLPRQLGYKNLKYLSRITVTDTVADVGEGLGGGAAEAGYSWYAGI
jgi:DMSO/TMAO reductase YedYZ molybdopterin-dependent catalytic subunit